MEDLIILFSLAAFCLISAVCGTIAGKFGKKISSIILITASITPSFTMLNFNSLSNSEITGWVAMLASPLLYLVALIGFLRPPVIESDKNACVITLVGFILSIAWLLSFLSAISLGHV